MTRKSEIERIARLDSNLVAIIKGFQILNPLSWPIEVQNEFLTSAKNNNLKLPKLEWPKLDYRHYIEALTIYIKTLGTEDSPALNFLRETAQSYYHAYQILQGIGTSAVSEHSYILYGGPKDFIPRYKRRNISVAKYFLRIASSYDSIQERENYIFSDETFAKKISEKIDKFFDIKEDPINVLIDKRLTARVAAGSNYVKVRQGACFSHADFMQLWHHEVLTHVLTYINGSKQPVLRTLGFSSPRTTATQEGLAVFAEYVNMSIELVRLKRIALRIVAIYMAENGADLIDLFNFFKKHGQNDEESYYSSMRIFRGGLPQGGIIFYKDNIYLKGLIEVEAFLKTIMHRGKVYNLDLLFSGKLTTLDALSLEPLVDENLIIPPKYMPLWAKKSGELAAHLAVNDLTERFKLELP